MFRNLLDLSRVRNGLEALGFYIAYLLGTALLNGLIGGTSEFFFPHSDRQATIDYSVKLGIGLAIILCLCLAVGILQQKKLLRNFWYLVTIVLIGMLALVGGPLIGLIPVAYLTTRQPAKS